MKNLKNKFKIKLKISINKLLKIFFKFLTFIKLMSNIKYKIIHNIFFLSKNMNFQIKLINQNFKIWYGFKFSNTNMLYLYINFLNNI